MYTVPASQYIHRYKKYVYKLLRFAARVIEHTLYSYNYTSIHFGIYCRYIFIFIMLWHHSTYTYIKGYVYSLIRAEASRLRETEREREREKGGGRGGGGEREIERQSAHARERER